MPWWRSDHIKHFALTRNMRAQSDTEYASFLEELGDGKYPSSPVDDDGAPLHPRCVRLPGSITAPHSWKAADLMQWVYGGYEGLAPASWSQFYENCMVVTPLNAAAAELNAMMLKGLPSDQLRTFLSHDSAVTDSDVDHYTPEFLNSLEPNGMPPHELQICPGSLMILLRNYSPQKGLCNGTRVVVRGQWRRLLQVQVVTGSARGQVHLLPRIVCDSTGDNELPFVLRRLQFPLRHAWAISINKAQGQTVSGRFGIYLPTPVFAHGQLYVAASRATGASNVRVLVHNDDDRQRKAHIGDDRAVIFTLNLVDQTLLHDGPADANAFDGKLQDSVPVGRGAGVKPPCSEVSEQEEQHRLATVLPEPLGAGTAGSHALAWDDASTSSIPFAADEWATTECGAPCATAAATSLLPLLEQQGSADGCVEYVSDAEDMDSRTAHEVAGVPVGVSP